MRTVRIKIERSFHPHLLLLLGAQHQLTRAKEISDGCSYDWLRAILMSALPIEATGNSYGKVLVPACEELISDRVSKYLGASPNWKLESVAKRCGINPVFESHPWVTARKVTKFRDLVAHAKRELLKVDVHCPLTDYGRVFGATFNSDVQAMFTEDFASESCAAVEKIIRALNETLEIAELYELAIDDPESLAQVLPDEVAYQCRRPFLRDAASRSVHPWMSPGMG